jgi:GNAT superfamily N-acetyltransferase
MIEIKCLTKYDEKLAAEMGKLLMQLSTKWDGSPVDRKWIEDVVKSPWHDELLAFDENGKLVGMASMSTVMGAKIGQNAYLEDFVVDSECRGQGVGTKMWNAILNWGREKKCKRLEFTASGNHKKAGAAQFYAKMGADIYDTNFFRVELS